MVRYRLGRRGEGLPLRGDTQIQFPCLAEDGQSGLLAGLVALEPLAGLGQGLGGGRDRLLPDGKDGQIQVPLVPILFLGAAQGGEAGVGARQFQGLAGSPEPLPLGGEGLVLGQPVLPPRRDIPQFGLQPGQSLMPGQGLVMLVDPAMEVRLLPVQVPQFFPKRCFGLWGEELQAIQLGLEDAQVVALHGAAFVDTDGDLAVDLRAGDLLQDGGALIGGRLEKGSEAALGQQHGAGEACEVHASDGLDLVGDTAQAGFEQGSGIGVGDLVPGLLELAIRLAPGTMLAPVAAETAGLGREGDLGEALARVAGHDLVFAFGYPVQARRAAVKGQADGVEEGRLAGAGGAGDGEEAIGVGGVGQVERPLTDQGVQILEMDVQNAHGQTDSLTIVAGVQPPRPPQVHAACGARGLAGPQLRHPDRDPGAFMSIPPGDRRDEWSPGSPGRPVAVPVVVQPGPGGFPGSG